LILSSLDYMDNRNGNDELNTKDYTQMDVVLNLFEL
jgi:hypothetical protein